MRQQQKAKRDAAAETAQDMKTGQTMDDLMEDTLDLEKDNTDEMLARLKQLGDLKEAGVITEAEFEKMKKRVMKDS